MVKLLSLLLICCKQIGSLHAVVSDKEYSVITSCVTMNMSEEAKLPPNFRDTSSGSMDTIRMLADKVNMTSQVFLSRTVNIMAVQLDYALLELCNGIQEDSPLANITVSTEKRLTDFHLHMFLGSSHAFVSNDDVYSFRLSWRACGFHTE